MLTLKLAVESMFETKLLAMSTVLRTMIIPMLIMIVHWLSRCAESWQWKRLSVYFYNDNTVQVDEVTDKETWVRWLFIGNTQDVALAGREMALCLQQQSKNANDHAQEIWLPCCWSHEYLTQHSHTKVSKWKKFKRKLSEVRPFQDKFS